VAQSTTKLVAIDGADNDFFGARVAIDQGKILIGAPQDDYLGIQSGSAYFFELDGEAWVQSQKVMAPDRAESDFFGNSVDLLDNVAVVCAFGDDTGAGSAYVYHFNGTEWELQQKLTGEAGDVFGRSVALGQDLILIGAPGSGSVYVFRYDGKTWSQQQRLVASDATNLTDFGVSVALSGDHLVVGAWKDDDVGPDAGSAYVFQFDGSTWIERQKLTATDGKGNDNLGLAVALTEDIVVAGATHGSELGSGGSAYVFRRNGSDWIQEQELVAGAVPENNFFGISVAARDTMVLVGAHSDGTRQEGTGLAYLFRSSNGAWIQDHTLAPTDGSTAHGLGWDVDISDKMAVVGAPGDDGEVAGSGAAYVFDLSGRTVQNDRVAGHVTRFSLSQNHPNPFNPSTTISYSLPRTVEVTLTFFDVLGREVRQLASGIKPLGTYEVTFDATGLPSGIYYYRLRAGDYVETKRMVVVR
jgi:hypothetical protein